MRKIGHKRQISPNIWDYQIGWAGPSGAGKTTISVEVARKSVGDEGYIHFNIGREDGNVAIANIVTEDIRTFQSFIDAVNEIVKNKETDYKDLKIIILDGMDELLELAEPYAIKKWNDQNMGIKDFRPARTIAASWSGFGKGEDKCCEYILDAIWKLKSVGVTCWEIFHSKVRSIIDPVTNSSYDVLSANISQRQFEAFKTKLTILAIVAIDRTIETQDTGRKNLVTKKAITTNKVVDERRRCYFRSTDFNLDAKSRFSDIVPDIPLDADTFIKAIQDAIDAEANKNDNRTAVSAENNVSDTKKADKLETQASENVNEESSIQTEDANDDDIDDIGMNEPVDEEYEYPENLKDEVIALYKSCKVTDTKNEAKAFISKFGKLSNVDEEGLRYLYDILRK